jgi:predicted site-specific integrase-resolvase
MSYFKTAGVAKHLGVSYAKLFELMRRGRLIPPAKDSSGDYIWSDEDIRRAGDALASTRARKAAVPA